MYVATKNISKKYALNLSDLESVMQDYTMRYCVALHNLCELGFSASPYNYDEIDFKTALVEEFPDEIKYLRKSLSSGISFSSDTVSYAIKASNNENFKEVMGVYSEVLTTKQALFDCKEFIGGIKFRRNGIGDTSVKIVASEGITKRSALPILPEFLLEKGCNDIQKVCICDCVIHELCKDIGLSEEEYESHKSTGTAFFLEGVSIEDEEILSECILKGNIPLKGKYGERLRNKMIEYYQTYAENYSDLKSVQLPYETVIYSRISSARVTQGSKIREEMYAKGYKELYIDNVYVYYQGYRDKHDILPQTINVGNICNIPDLTEIFSGLQGVFTSEPMSEDSVPANIKGYGIIYFANAGDYKELILEDLYKEYNCSTEEEFKGLIHKFSEDTLTEELVFALLRAKCGYTQYTFTTDLSGVTREEYDNCCKDALRIVGYTFNLL